MDRLKGYIELEKRFGYQLINALYFVVFLLSLAVLVVMSYSFVPKKPLNPLKSYITCENNQNFLLNDVGIDGTSYFKYSWQPNAVALNIEDEIIADRFCSTLMFLAVEDQKILATQAQELKAFFASYSNTTLWNESPEFLNKNTLLFNPNLNLSLLVSNENVNATFIYEEAGTWSRTLGILLLGGFSAYFILNLVRETALLVFFEKSISWHWLYHRKSVMGEAYESNRQWIFWLLIVFSIEGIVMLFLQIELNDPLFTVGLALLYVFIFAIFVRLILFKFFQNTPKPMTMAFLLSVIIVFNYQAYLENQETQRLYKTAKTFVAMTDDVDFSPEQIKSMELGKYQNLMLLTENNLNKINTLFIQYLKTNAKILQNAPLNMVSLTDPIISEKNLKYLAEIDMNINKTKAQLLGLLNTISERINNLDMPWKEKFLKRIQDKSKKMSRFFIIESNLVESNRKLYDFIKACNGNYTMTSGKITFYKKEDAEQFNALIKDLKFNEQAELDSPWYIEQQKIQQKMIEAEGMA